MTSSDPTYESWLVPLKALLERMDAAIGEVYRRRGIEGLRPRYAMPLIRLHHLGALSVKALAAETGVTHSAMSQTVAAMRTAGFVASTPGPDARTRLVGLTPEGRDLVPFLEVEWRATEAAVRALDAELAHPILAAIADVGAALDRRDFADRVSAELDRLSAEQARRPSLGLAVPPPWDRV